MNQKITLFLSNLILILFLIQTTTIAQQDNEPIPIGTYRILHSSILNEDRTVLINLPRDYDGATISYPVVYLLYGDQVMGYFAESVHFFKIPNPKK